MYEASVNYLAAFVSAIVFFGIGSLWYGPLFSKPWMKSVGLTAEELEMNKGDVNLAVSFGTMFLGSLLMTFVLAHLIDYLQFVFPHSGSVKVGLTTAGWSWLGFTLSYILTAPAFERRPWIYVLINGGYWLVGMLVTGIIVGLWQ